MSLLSNYPILATFGAIMLSIIVILCFALKRTAEGVAIIVITLLLSLVFNFSGLVGSSVVAEKTVSAIKEVTGESVVEIEKGKFNRNGDHITAQVLIGDDIFNVDALSINEGGNFLTKDKSIVIISIKKGNIVYYNIENKEWQ